MVILLAASLSAAAEAPAFDRFIAFRAPQACLPAPAFQAFIDQLLTDSGPGRLELGRIDLPPALRAAAARPRLERASGTVGGWTAILPVTGRWHGLPLTTIGVTETADGDWHGFALTFRATPSQVRAAANLAGLALPASGRRVFADDLNTTIAIRRQGQTTVLSCFTG